MKSYNNSKQLITLEQIRNSSIIIYLTWFFVLGNLFNQADYSDIELVVESENFYAHRIILAARSDYFRALLYGGLRESRNDNHTIEIKECKAEAFKILLYYIYTGRASLVKEKVIKNILLYLYFCIF